MGELIWLIPRVTAADSRLHNPWARLKGANLRWRRYRRWTSTWLHGACEFCQAEFSEDGEPGTLHSGYSVLGAGPTGQDDYSWICAICFEDLRDRFGWTVLDTRSEPRLWLAPVTTPLAAFDDRPRCWWPDGSSHADPAMVAYHDDEWARPVSNDAALFERLSLEVFQAGLSWSTILHKRREFARAFAGFDPERVRAFDEIDRQRLVTNAGIVRNWAKVEATIGNAAAFLEAAAEHGSFAAYLAAQLPRPAPMLPPDATSDSVPATTAESDALSAHLRHRGFRFVGSTIVYAFMQSVGLVDDHLPACHRYRG